MDVSVLLYYVGFGAMVKLLTIRRPTPGRQYAAGIEVLAGAIVASHLASVFGESLIAMVFVSIPFGFMSVGIWITTPLDRARIWYKQRLGHGTGSENRRQDS